MFYGVLGHQVSLIQIRRGDRRYVKHVLNKENVEYFKLLVVFMGSNESKQT